jgi:hypothetical protein
MLVDQPTMRRRTKLDVLAALDQRIGLCYAMPPTTEKTGSYLRHYLKLAGRRDTLFSDEAVALIFFRPAVATPARLTTSPASARRRIRHQQGRRCRRSNGRGSLPCRARQRGSR